MGNFCEPVSIPFDFLWRLSPLRAKVREKIGTHYSPGDPVGGEVGTRPSCHLPWWIRMNSFVLRCKGPGKKNGAGLRSGSPTPTCCGIPGCHCHLHLAEKKSGVDPRPGRDGCHVGPHGGGPPAPMCFKQLGRCWWTRLHCSRGSVMWNYPLSLTSEGWFMGFSPPWAQC